MSLTSRLAATAATALVAGASATLLSATPAAALSCVGVERVLKDAEQAFTGRILDAQDGRLLVEVDEVWQGGPVEERVWLAVEMPGWTAWADPGGEVPDGYSSHRRWLFAPLDGAVNPCTAWSALEPYVAKARPASVGKPVPDGSLGDSQEATAPDGGGGWLAMTAAGGGALAAAVTGFALVRRRRGSTGS